MGLEDWVSENFEVVDNKFGDEEDSISGLCFRNKGGNKVYINMNSFLALTEGVSVPPTLEGLKQTDPEDKKGWHKYFENWKTEGLISE